MATCRCSSCSVGGLDCALDVRVAKEAASGSGLEVTLLLNFCLFETRPFMISARLRSRGSEEVGLEIVKGDEDESAVRKGLIAVDAVLIRPSSSASKPDRSTENRS